MGKDCGRGNERLDEKALAVYHVAEGEAVGRKSLQTYWLVYLFRNATNPDNYCTVLNYKTSLFRKLFMKYEAWTADTETVDCKNSAHTDHKIFG